MSDNINHEDTNSLQKEVEKLRDLLRTNGTVEADACDVELLKRYFPRLSDFTSYVEVDVHNDDIKQLRMKFLIDVASIQDAICIAWSTGEVITKKPPSKMVARLTRNGQWYLNKARFPS